MFSHLDIGALSVVMQYFPPEEVVRLSLVNKSFYKASRAETYWKQATSLYFPEAYRNNKANGWMNWFQLFSEQYEFHFISGTQGKIITALILGDMPTMYDLPLTHTTILQDCANIHSIMTWALSRGDQPILDFLFTRIAATFTGVENDRYGRTLTHWAIICRQAVEVIDPLLDADMMTKQDANKCIPIDYAARYSCPELFELFYRKRSRILELYAENAQTPLERSAYFGHFENVDVILEREAGQGDVQAYLDYALFNGMRNAKIVRALLDHGANPLRQFRYHDYSHQTVCAYQSALHHDNQMALDLFADYCLNDVQDPWTYRTMLQYVTQQRRISDMQQLLAMGADPNIGDEFGQTPLMICMGGQEKDESRLPMIELLLKHGAQITLTRHGESALTYALSNGRIDALRLLVANGADLNTTHKGKNVIHRMIASYPQDELTLLPDSLMVVKELGADFAALTASGLTVINCALEELALDVMLILFKFDQDNLFQITALHQQVIHGENILELSGNVNQCDLSGMTALFYAVIFGHEQAVNALLSAGALVNIENNNGMSPLHCAILNLKPNKNIIDALLNAGAYIHARNNKIEVSPMMLVEEYSSVDSDDDDMVDVEKFTEIKACFSSIYQRKALGEWFETSAVVQLLMKHLLPEDVRTLMLVSDSTRRAVKYANSIWKSKMEVHFPHHMPPAEEHPHIKWMTLFTDTYRRNYTVGLPARRRISAVKEGKTEGLLADITYDELTLICDMQTMSLLDWLHYYKRQTLLDMIYHNEKIIFPDASQRAILCHQPINVLEEMSSAILLEAAACGHMVVVKSILDNFAIDRETQQLAYYQAAQHGHLDVLQYMNGRGFKSLTDYPTLSAIMLSGHSAVLRYLLERLTIGVTIGVNQLMLERGHLQTARILWEYRHRTTLWSDQHINSTFIYAVVGKNTILVDFFLRMGIDTQSAFEYALDLHELESLQILMRSGVNTYPSMLKTLLKGDWDTVEVLLQAGLDLRRRDTHCHTYLMHAAFHGNTELVAWLLKRMDVHKINKCDVHGNTALMWAAYQGSATNVEALINAGADCTLVNYRNEDALIISIQRGHHLVTKLLLHKKLEYFAINELTPRKIKPGFWSDSLASQCRALAALNQLLHRIYDRGLGQHSLIQAMVLHLDDLEEELAFFSRGKLATLLQEIIALDVNAVMASKELNLTTSCNI